MRAVLWHGKLTYQEDYPEPAVPPGWARIRVETAGVCQTDMELIEGYLGFTGVLGHEFVGIVDTCENSWWIGKRVAGEINAACGKCAVCRDGLGRHCPERLTLGIDRLDGCMADYCVLPVANLIEIPDDISPDRAVFIEPLSAACEILEQVPLKGTERVIVLGDGRLGILCAWVLSTAAADVTLVGRHREKLEMAAWHGIQTCLAGGECPGNADVVVEATGSGIGLTEAMRLCRPRGVIVLKSTTAAPHTVNLSPIVIHELTVVGSRCGQFRDGLRLLRRYPDMPVERLITHRYPIIDAVSALEQAAGHDAVKVLIDMHRGA